MGGKKNILIVTTGQPSSNPRMVKEYQVLKKAGYEVRVIYAFWVSWAAEKDRLLFEKQEIDKNDFILAGGDPKSAVLLYWLTRIWFKLMQVALEKLHIHFPEEWMISRASFSLERAAAGRKADLYIAHNLGALSACVKAARKWKAKCGFDAEDYHRGEYERAVERGYLLTKKVEDKFLPLCDYTTSASPLIREAYKRIDPVQDFTVINNVFSIRHLQSADAAGEGPLRIFWFSQTIGANRGLETLVLAMESLSDHEMSLHLMGEVSAGYRQTLLGLCSFPERIHFIEPVLPDEIFAIAAGFDIGYAAETAHCENRDFCLTNKIFTYLLAGNCILASDTSAQRKFFADYPGIGMLYRSGDEASLGQALKTLHEDRGLVRSCRKNALQLAAGRLNWEQESQQFLHIINKTLTTV